MLGSHPASRPGPLGELTVGVIEGDQSRASGQRVADPHFGNQTLGRFLALLSVSSEHQGDRRYPEWDLEVGEGRLMQPSRVGDAPPLPLRRKVFHVIHARDEYID